MAPDGGDGVLVNTFTVPGTPEDIKAWWIDLPGPGGVYEAEDEREQPHRIEHVRDTADGAIYDTFWRGPLGMEFKLTEHLHDDGPGRWRFVVPSPGFEIVDRYTAELVEGDGEARTELVIRSTVTTTHWYGKLTRPLMLPNWTKQLTETFSDAVDVYRDQHQG